MSQKQISNVRAHNERMRLLKEKNNDTAAFNVRQFSNPFMLASTQSLLTQLVAKSGGAVPTTSSSLGTVAEPFDTTPTTKAETTPLAGESTVGEEAAKVFLSAQEKAEAADEDTQHIKHIKRLKQSTPNSRRLQKQPFPLGGRCKTQPINSPQNWRKILRLIKNRKSPPRMIISHKWKKSKWAPGTREHVGFR